MKLFKLKNKNVREYDIQTGFVIRAESAKAARKIANDSSSGEGRIWEDPKKVICNRLIEDGKSEIILDSFRNG